MRGVLDVVVGHHGRHCSSPCGSGSAWAREVARASIPAPCRVGGTRPGGRIDSSGAAGPAVGPHHEPTEQPHGDDRRDRRDPAVRRRSTAADRERLAQTCRRHPARRRASTPCTRATSARSSPCSTAGSRSSSSSTGSSACSASACPGAIFGEVPITLGTPFPSGFRAAEPSRVMRVEARELLRGRRGGARGRGEGRRARARAHRRAAGRRRRAAAAARDRARAPLGRGLLGPAPLPRPQPDHVRLADARRRATPPSAGAATCPPDGDCPAVRVAGRHDARATAAARGRRAARPADAARPPAEYDTIVIGAGPAGLAAAVYGASEGLRTIVIEREAPGGQAGTSSRIENYLGFPSGVSGDELGKPRAPAGAPARRGDPRHALDHRHRPGDAHACTSTAATCCAARTIILATGVTWRHLAIDGFERLIGKGVYYGASRSEAPSTHGLDVHIIGAGNSAGQAALFFASHARTRHDRLPRRRAREEHVAVPRRPGPRASRTSRSSSAPRSSAVHGDATLERDRHPRSRDRATTTRRECGGLFIFIGADAETRPGCRPRSRSTTRGYVLTGADVAGRGRWNARARPVPARDERARHLRLRRRALQPGQARRGGGRRGQHGDRLRPPVPADPPDAAARRLRGVPAMSYRDSLHSTTAPSSSPMRAWRRR